MQLRQDARESKTVDRAERESQEFPAPAEDLTQVVKRRKYAQCRNGIRPLDACDAVVRRVDFCEYRVAPRSRLGGASVARPQAGNRAAIAWRRGCRCGAPGCGSRSSAGSSSRLRDRTRFSIADHAARPSAKVTQRDIHPQHDSGVAAGGQVHIGVAELAPMHRASALLAARCKQSAEHRTEGPSLNYLIIWFAGPGRVSSLRIACVARHTPRSALGIAFQSSGHMFESSRHGPYISASTLLPRSPIERVSAATSRRTASSWLAAAARAGQHQQVQRFTLVHDVLALQVESTPGCLVHPQREQGTFTRAPFGPRGAESQVRCVGVAGEGLCGLAGHFSAFPRLPISAAPRRSIARPATASAHLLGVRRGAGSRLRAVRCSHRAVLPGPACRRMALT